MWVARVSNNLGKLFDYDLSPKFNDIYDCQKYIDEKLKEIEKKLQNIFDEILTQYNIVNKRFCINFGGHFIRCYNIEQQRFCTGFDF